MQQNLPSDTRTIGEHEYTVYRLGFRDFRRLLALSGSVFGPGITDLLSGVDLERGVDALLSLDAGVVAEGALKIFGELGSKNGEEILRMLASSTAVDDDGKTIRLWTKAIDHADQWFALYPGEFILWLAYCYEFQCADFFAEPARRAKDYLGKMGQKP
jgi:hypothetical protein